MFHIAQFHAADSLITHSDLQQNLSITAIASAEVHGTATIVTGAITVSPTAIATAEALGTAVMILKLLPGAIVSLEAHGTAMVASIISPTSIAGVEAFGTAVMVPEEMFLQPIGISSTEKFPKPAILTTWTAIADPTTNTWERKFA